MKFTASVLLTLALAVFAGPASPHHSVGTNYFDYEEAPLELMGTITEVEIRTPHSLLKLEVGGDNGEVVEWLIEWSDGNALHRRGVAVDLVKVGQDVTIHARTHRRVERVAYVRDVVIPDGTIVRDCGARGVFQGGEYYATCDEAEESAP